jgi:hypothetical protein
MDDVRRELIARFPVQQLGEGLRTCARVTQ